jgi:hypothetical protein
LLWGLSTSFANTVKEITWSKTKANIKTFAISL